MADVAPELAELLTAEPLTAHLATSRDGKPHVAPLWYLYDDGVVRIVTTGRKLADIRENPYVSLSVEKSEHGLPEWTATLRGTATVVDDREAFDRVNGRINEKYNVGGDAWEENTLVRIDIGSSSYRTY
jgi:nitroimidazol reductase NimA-like FMN-containing flavoprotein (pyridoxamine 5'-phosphate oxidase superfamily)